MKSLERIIKEVAAGKQERGSYKNLSSSIRSVYEGMLNPKKREDLEKDHRDQVVAGTYKTQHFEMCPSAQKLYAQGLPDDVDHIAAEMSLIKHDMLFDHEKKIIAKERSTESDVDYAENLIKQIMAHAKEMGLEKEHGYLQGHLDRIKSFVKPHTNIVGDDEEAVKEISKRFNSKPYDQTAEPPDRDIDNDKFKVSHSIKAQRKLKIIDND